MRGLHQNREKKQRQIEGMEYFLLEALSPVAPSQEFVSDLRSQLANFTIPKPIPPSKIGQYTFFALITLLGGGLVLAILIRYVIALVVILTLKHQAHQENVSSTI